jgi:hypothetical protein
MLSLRSITDVRPGHWILLVLGILALDYATGPYIQLALLFLLPVALATASQGLVVGLGVAVALPILRLSFFAKWALPASWTLQIVDTSIDVALLVAIALMVDYIVRQDREIQVLEGLLPICSFCKRIRDEQGEWRQLETYIAARSLARFSHTFCRDCGRREYPDLAD